MSASLRTAAALVVPAVLAYAQDGRTADLILRHGAVYTMDAAPSWVESVAVANGRIIFAGTDAGAARLAAHSTKVVDLGGHMVLPGFHDSHVHLMEGGVDMSLCNVKSIATPQQVLAEIRKFAAAHPDNPGSQGRVGISPCFPRRTPAKSN